MTIGPIAFASDCDYASGGAGLFRDFLNGSNINRGGDNFGGGRPALNFNSGASNGTNGLTLFDTDPTNTLPTLWSGSIGLSVDTIQAGTNANRPGLAALFNEGVGRYGLALVLSEAGSTDTLELHRIPQSGDLTTSTIVKSASVNGLISDAVWYRLTLDVQVSGDGLAVTGKFFGHAVSTDPRSAVNATPSGTLTYSGSLTGLGLQGAGQGQAGLVFDVGASTSKASFTNFQITGSVASSGTDPLPARLSVIKHVVNDNGGTATAPGFTISVGGCSFPGAEAPGSTVFLKPATSLSVAETGPAGYTQTLSAGCTGPLAGGDVKTCTVTNDDNAVSPNEASAVSDEESLHPLRRRAAGRSR